MLWTATLMVAGSAALGSGALAAAPAPLDLQDDNCAPGCPTSADERTDPALGLTVRPRLWCGHDDLQHASGLLVTAVHAGKAAAQAGLEQGDVILGVDGKAVTSFEELQAALRAALNRPAFILVARDDAFLVRAFPAL